MSVRSLLIVLSAFTTLVVLADESLYWYNDGRKVLIQDRHYDATLRSYVYSFDGSPHTRRILTGDIIVKFAVAPDARGITDLQAAYGVALIKRLNIGAGYYVFRATDKEASLALANRLNSDIKVRYAYPDWQTLPR